MYLKYFDLVSNLGESVKSSNNQLSDYENDIIFQNWVEEVIQKESETDRYLEELKKEPSLTNFNQTDNSKVANSLSWTDDDKIPNISDIDLDSLFLEKSDQFHNFENSKQTIKCNVNSPNSSRKIKSQMLLKKSNTKLKTPSIPIKQVKDFVQLPCNKEVDSWMSNSLKKQSHSKNTSRSTCTYQEILTNLEEFESDTASKFVDYQQDVPQHDTDGKVSRSESIDDIVSILEVLENENKKSSECTPTYYTSIIYYYLQK